MGMNQLAGLLRGNSHNGKSHPLSERDAYMRIYGERPIGNHSARVVPAGTNGNGRARDARGRFVPSATKQRAGS
jgi:hypothetical protein